MLVLGQLVGESVVIAQELLVSLTHVDAGVARMTLTDLFAPENVSSKDLRRNEPVEIRPDVQLTFLQPLAEKPGIRLGIAVPPELPVHRKEVLDVIRGQG
jgi:sRNA-binding carbon storage regulator CsrA